MRRVNYVKNSIKNGKPSQAFFAPNVRIPAPRILRIGDKLPVGETTTLDALCKKAGLTYKVSGGFPPLVILIRGHNNEHLTAEKDGRKIYFVNLDLLPEGDDTEQAVRVLETAAYGFHDYYARECVRGIFKAFNENH